MSTESKPSFTGHRHTDETRAVMSEKHKKGALDPNRIRSMTERRNGVRELTSVEKEEIELRALSGRIPLFLGEPNYDEFCEIKNIKPYKNSGKDASRRHLLEEVYAGQLCYSHVFKGDFRAKLEPVTPEEVERVNRGRYGDTEYEILVQSVRDQRKKVQEVNSLFFFLPRPLEEYHSDIGSYMRKIDSNSFPLLYKKALLVLVASCLTDLSTTQMGLISALKNELGYSEEETARYLRIAQYDLPEKLGYDFLEGLINVKDVDGRTNRRKQDKFR